MLIYLEADGSYRTFPLLIKRNSGSTIPLTMTDTFGYHLAEGGLSEIP